uniref:Ig-like domain-containing protein n=1 Tax=Chelonoidis abingdonii TaxID=106734 RepID=A0A8C0GAY9_CHEAB
CCAGAYPWLMVPQAVREHILSCSFFPFSETVTFSPEKLSMPVGDTASFFCSISTANFPQSDYSLNWYKKINSTHTKKIAEFNGNEHKNQKKFLLVNHTSSVEIKIQHLTENDSGEYFCGLIAFSSPSKPAAALSSRVRAYLLCGRQNTGCWLSETEGAVWPGRHLSASQRPVRRFQSTSPSKALPIWIPGLVAGIQELSSALVTMYTVDYGVLEFQQDEHTEAPVESYPPDNTEYAVIVFPEEKPVTPERGKKMKHQRTCQI